MASNRDDDELSWWDLLRTRSGDEEEETLSPPPLPDESFNAQERVKALILQPLFGESAPAEVPTLRSAASEQLRSAGLFGSAAPFSAIPTSGSPDFDGDEDQRPKSWKLPAPKRPPIILGDDTALGAGRFPADIAGKGAPDDPAAVAPPAPGIDNQGGTATTAPPPSAPPRENPAGPAASPLDHPDAQTGLALTAADALLRRGVEALAQVAGGNRALMQQVVEGAVAWLGGVLPTGYEASATKSGETALADANRRIDEHERATRTRAAIGTLANRRIEAEREHAQAVIAGDPAKLAEARREAIDAWRAERIARGDGHAEINAGARALDAQYRKTALQHRLAQMDEAGIQRALDEDEDAKADPAAARAVAEDILRTRRDDPARAGQASIERAIEQKKRDGRIDTPEEEPPPATSCASKPRPSAASPNTSAASSPTTSAPSSPPSTSEPNRRAAKPPLINGSTLKRRRPARRPSGSKLISLRLFIGAPRSHPFNRAKLRSPKMERSNRFSKRTTRPLRISLTVRCAARQRPKKSAKKGRKQFARKGWSDSKTIHANSGRSGSRFFSKSPNEKDFSQDHSCGTFGAGFATDMLRSMSASTRHAPLQSSRASFLRRQSVSSEKVSCIGSARSFVSMTRASCRQIRSSTRQQATFASSTFAGFSRAVFSRGAQRRLRHAADAA